MDKVSVKFYETTPIRGRMTYPLDESDEHIPAPAIAAHKPQGFRHTPVSDPPTQSEHINSHINSLLRHRSVSRPFASSDRQQPAGTDMQHMISDQSLRARSTWVPHQWPQATPGTQHITSADLNIRGQVPPHLLEDPADLLLGGTRFAFYGGRRVGGAGDGVALPGEEEDDAAVRGRRVEQTHFAGRVVVRERDVDSGGGLYDRLVCRVIEGQQDIGEGPGGVDDSLRSESVGDEEEDGGWSTFARIFHSSPVRLSLSRAPLSFPDVDLCSSVTSQ
jgi:hypothetical protein